MLESYGLRVRIRLKYMYIHRGVHMTRIRGFELWLGSFIKDE